MATQFRDGAGPLSSSEFAECPSDISEIVDLYLLHRLEAREMQAFEEHFLACPACAEKAEIAAEFIGALRETQAGSMMESSAR